MSEKNVQIIDNATWDDVVPGDRITLWKTWDKDGSLVSRLTIRRPITKEN